MRKLIFILTCLLFIGTISQAQTTRVWTGGAAGDWDNANNWQTLTLPADGDIVEFLIDVTVTSTVPITVTPAQVKAASGRTVVLDLDLTIGNGTYTEDALYGVSAATIQIGTGGMARTVTVNLPVTQKAFWTTGTTSSLLVSTNSTLDVVQAQNGFNGGSIINDGTINIQSGVVSRAVNHSGAGSTFINNGTFNISNPNQSNAIEMANQSSFTNNGTVNINDYNLFGVFLRSNGSFANLGMLNISGAVNNNSNGIDVNGGTFTNDGTINVNSAKKMGIRTRVGPFSNNGIITITDAAGQMDRGIESNTLFTNGTGASISVGPMQFAGVYVNGGSTFQNDGTLTVEASAINSSNTTAGLVVFDGTFNNTSNNSLNADGGANANNRRAINVESAGTLNNSGTITSSGGFINQNVRSGGTIVNECGGTMELGDGRVAINAGSTFTNDGFMRSTHTSGVGVQVNGTGVAINNAFYDFAGNSFGTGSVTDNGIDLNGSPIDAMDLNTVDIAEQPYTWFDGGTSLGTASSTGMLTIATPSAANITITTDKYDPADVSIDIINLPFILPIELISFEAYQRGTTTLVKWQTGLELNNAYMAVERASENGEFVEVGRVKGAADNRSGQSYSIVDYSPQDGINYYRLKQVDFDGTSTYGDAVAVVHDLQSNGKDLLVYPNSTSDKISVTLGRKSSPEAAIYIVNTMGQVMKVCSGLDQKQIDISLSEMPSAQYILVYKDRGVQFTERIMKL